MHARFNSRHDKSSSEFKFTIVYFSNITFISPSHALPTVVEFEPVVGEEILHWLVVDGSFRLQGQMHLEDQRMLFSKDQLYCGSG